MYGVWGKINDWWVHLRTRQGAGAGGNRHGRQYPAYLQAVRNLQDEDRSSNSREGKEKESKLLGIEGVPYTIAVRQKLKMEEEAQWTGRPEKQWRMTMNKGQMQTALTKVSDTFAKLDEYNFKDLLGNTAVFANMKLENPVDEWSLAIIMSAFADAKTSIMPERVEAYRESIMWTAIAADLKEEKRNQLPRVNTAIEAALSNYNPALNTPPFTEQN